MRTFFLMVAAGVLGLAGVSNADPILAYSSSPSQAPNQSYGGNFGMDFTPTQNVSVTELGLYSGNFGAGAGGSGFSGDDFATLFDSNGVVLAQLEFGGATGNGSLVSGTSNYVKPLSTPVPLTAGQTYTIAAFYTNGTDQLANAGGGAAAPSETGSPYISYTGSGRFGGGTASSYPGTTDGGPANRYNGPTFGFTVPEPGTLGLIGLSMVGFLARRRNR